MSEQIDLDALIADNRKWVQLHRENKYQREAAKRMTGVLDALESTLGERDEARKAAEETPRLSRSTIEEEIAQTIEDNVFLSPWDTERDRMVSAITTALSPLLNRVRAEAAAKAIQAHRDLHPTYGSTAACGGGIGGMTLTEHCAVVCQNPKHDAAKAAWHEVEMAYFESRRIEQNSEGSGA